MINSLIHSFTLSVYCPYRRSMDFGELHWIIANLNRQAREKLHRKSRHSQFHPLILEFINLDRNITMYRLMNQAIHNNSQESDHIQHLRGPRKCFPFSWCQNKIFKKKEEGHFRLDFEKPNVRHTITTFMTVLVDTFWTAFPVHTPLGGNSACTERAVLELASSSS